MTRPASPEVAAINWLATIANLADVSEELPADQTAWAASGYVTVAQIGGGYRDDSAMRRDRLLVSVWGVRPNSQRPPHHKTAAMAERILEATRVDIWDPVHIDPAGDWAGYHDLYIWRAAVVGGPARNPFVDGNLARYDITLELDWTQEDTT